MKIMKNYNRGFTLIELLVVIAIIGILSAIVLASLSTAKSKAYDAKVKGQLSEIRDAAELYADTNGTYGATIHWTSNGTGTNGCQGGMFTDTASGMANLSVSANYPSGANTIVCNSIGTAYAVSDNLSTAGQYWCVDSTQTSKQESAALGTATACP
jgi:prepilin-type N-terminal cleavage/methylation domain-containing protein